MPLRATTPQTEPTVAGPAATRKAPIADADAVRAMAAAGLSRIQIAGKMGCNKRTVDNFMFRHGIHTHAPRGVPKQPAKDNTPIHGCGGEKPDKLMPSATALRAVSVWSLAGV